jgi:hypothetical protein
MATEMEEIRIQQNSKPDIVFQGQLVANADGERNRPTAFGRWHEVSVYLRSDGLWVVCIAFNTLCVHETPSIDVDVVDRADDVETVLMIYEPTERLNRRWIRPRYEVDKRKLIRTLQSNFDELINQIIARIRPVERERVSASTATPPPSERR